MEKRILSNIKREFKKLSENPDRQYNTKELLEILENIIIKKNDKYINNITERCEQQIASIIITRFIRCYPKYKLIKKIKECANNVYSELSHGWNEKVYQEALKIELSIMCPEINISSEVTNSISYKNKLLGDGVYIRNDIKIMDSKFNNLLLLELKSIVSNKSNIEKAVNQCKRYLRLVGMNVGLVINFPDKLYGRVYFRVVLV